MNWLDVVLPFTWWQRVLIVLVLLMFSPLLIAVARIAWAAALLVVGSVRVLAGRARRRIRPSPARDMVEAFARPMRELAEEYAARLASGAVLPPRVYLDRCHRLVGRGLSRDLAQQLAEAHDAALLRRIEACTDAELEHLSAVAEFTNRHVSRNLLPWQWPLLLLRRPSR